MVVTSDETRNKDIDDTRIGKVNTVLLELYRYVVTKRELSNITKLSVVGGSTFRSLAYGHESWVMAERVLSQVQAVEMGFLRRVHGLELRDKVRSCDIFKAIDVTSIKIPAALVLSRGQNPQKSWRILLATLTGNQP